MKWLLENKKLVGILLSVVATFFAGWTTRSWYEASIDQKIARVKDEVTTAVAGQITGIKVENKVTYAKTVEKISHEVQYRECAQDATMLQLTNKALTGE